MTPSGIPQYSQSVSYSAIIIAASSYSRWELTQRPTQDASESQTLEHTAVKEMSPLKPFPQSSGNSKEDAKRTGEKEGTEGTRRTKPSKSAQQSAYELTNIQTVNTGPKGFAAGLGR